MSWFNELPELTSDATEVGSYDSDDGWGFNIVAIVKDSKGYHVVSSSGCSCPSREEMARHDAGPFDSYSIALSHVPETHKSHLK